ncbi:MAG: hypothetical protein AABY22_22865 [Nanoarchaeota archaeon]
MNPFEFIKFEKTPGEKYQGIAYVKAWGKIILRYKIIPTKDGVGYFVGIDCHKKPGVEGKYEDAFMLDSNGDKELIEDMIRKVVNQAMANPNAHHMPNAQLPHNPQWTPNQYVQQPIQQQDWNTSSTLANDLPLPF